MNSVNAITRTRVHASTSRSWPNEYVGLPFLADGRDRSGLDCWGLVCLVYQEMLGVTLFDYKGVFDNDSVASLLRRAKLMDRERRNWEWRSPYEIPQAFDVALLRTKGVPSHVGIVIDSRNMLHIAEGIDSCIEEYTGPLWKNRVIGFYWRAHE